MRFLIFLKMVHNRKQNRNHNLKRLKTANTTATKNPKRQKNRNTTATTTPKRPKTAKKTATKPQRWLCGLRFAVLMQLRFLLRFSVFHIFTATATATANRTEKTANRKPHIGVCEHKNLVFQNKKKRVRT